MERVQVVLRDDANRSLYFTFAAKREDLSKVNSLISRNWELNLQVLTLDPFP